MVSDSWQKFLDGDESSFSALYSEYFKVLFAYGLKIGFNEENVKDAIQEVFINIYTLKKKLTHINDIEYYLFSCTKNKLFDLHNQQKRLSYINIEKVELAQTSTTVDKIILNEKSIQNKNRLAHLLKKLSPSQRKIIYLRYNINLSINEIALILNSKPASIKKNIQRALKKLKDTPHINITTVLSFLTLFS